MTTFRMSGPLEVWADSRMTSFAARREMVVLGILLLEPNRLVTTDRLVAAVWDRCPPHTAARQIQTCAWRLRRALAEAGVAKDVIVTQRGGYSIALAPGERDADVFEAELGHADTALLRDDLPEAVSRLRGALSVWRGPILAGVTGSVVRAHAERWDERRQYAMEKRFELELRLGRHHEVVGDLRVSVSDEPLRERLRALLMIALHRSGRTSEALEVYRSGRRTLIEREGIEPGRTLQAVHHSILVGAPDPSVPGLV
ncbi:BTAD domain-containing putative transcriptional regulator [Spirillospora sp. NPDC127200]